MGPRSQAKLTRASAGFCSLAGKTGHDAVSVVVRSSKTGKAEPRPGPDTDNVPGAWLERQILGTQLGPNKNGRRW
jgi:hypothetical protein